jgi:hypothetical protein
MRKIKKHMEYEINITKLELNPKYQEKMEEKNQYFQYGYKNELPEKYIKIQQTLATLSQEQWARVQKAIIEVL